MNEPTVSRATVHTDQLPMQAALDAARRALAAGEPPIGACLTLDGRIIATAHTGVAGGPDATAHAEILAIREACRVLRTPRLDDCVLYTTVEPCPMCLAACHYAGIGQVQYGASLAELHRITGRELQAARPAGVELRGGVLAEQCGALLAEWVQARGRRSP